MVGINGSGAKQVNSIQNHFTVTFRFRKNILGQNERGIQVQDAFCVGPDNIVALTPALALPVWEK